MRSRYIIFASCFLLCACNGSQEKQKDIYQITPMHENHSVAPHNSITHTQPSSVNLNEQSKPVECEPVKAAPVQDVTISKEYEEGYDAGYDDGEDDAVGGNGYEGQYDDACRYKGQKRKDFQLGYAEGYEAGYYDNVSD